MISREHFPDNFPREFVLRKGLCKILDDGTTVKDEAVENKQGPLKIISGDYRGPTCHYVYNLQDKDGNKLLQKDIRKITYYEEGFYLLEDNNEDELLNNGKVKGGFLAVDYKSCMNVMREDGTLLSEEWFLKVVPDIGFFHVTYNNRYWYDVNLSGEEVYFEEYDINFCCSIRPTENGYAIFNSRKEKISDEYQSFMWSHKGIWNVSLLHNGKRKTFFHGDGEAIIEYAQQVLIKNNILAIGEKEGIWYTIDSVGNVRELFYWVPNT